MKRAFTLLALGLARLPAWAARPAVKVETFKGKVVPLADLLAKSDAKLDADAAPYWLALQTDDGKVYPLVKDAMSRLFFKDKALLNRAMQLTGQFVPGSTLLRVNSVHSVRKGELFEVYYWCEICAIRRGELEEMCECCGGPMELKEEAVKK